jgi:hypothetical protein
LETKTASWAEMVDSTEDLGENEADPNAARAMNTAAGARMGREGAGGAGAGRRDGVAGRGRGRPGRCGERPG